MSKRKQAIKQADITRLIKGIEAAGHTVTLLKYCPFNGLQAEVGISQASVENDWDKAVS